MRRACAGAVALLAAMSVLLAVPVSAAPLPEPEPVATSADEVAMGSVAAPAADVAVQQGTTDPVPGVDEQAPTLTLTRTQVEEFSLVGVTWAYDPAVTDTVVQVRVQDAAGTWGSWTEIGTETADQATAAPTGAPLRGGTSPLWTGPSTGVEVELVTRSGAQPVDVQLDLVDPGTSAADTSLSSPEVTDTAHADTTMPPVYSRAQWGADESLRTWAPQYAKTITAATLHHTADSNDYTADQVPAIMRSIYRYHTVSLGWGDIGYNVIVDKFGRLWEGRSGGLQSTVIGAHAGGFNTGTFGVSMLGNYDIAPTTQPMIDAVAAIIAWKFSLYGVNPRGTTTLTSSGGGTSRYAAGQQVTLPTIFAHRDVGATACPGQYGYARLGEIRDKVAARMGGSSQTIAARYSADPTVAWLGAKVGAEQTSGGVTWQVYQYGRMYWSPSTGAHALKNGILDRYLELGGPSALGAPTTDELVAADRVGAYTHFQRGSIFWSPAGGAHAVRNALRDGWAAVGWERGPLGYPVEEETAIAGGWAQQFGHGTLYWSAATGAHEVVNAIGQVYDNAGGSAVLGFPTTGELPTADGRGRYQAFQSATVFWSPRSGAHAVRNALGARYAQLGWERGPLGYPTGEERSDAAGAWSQEFEFGRVQWSAATGAHEVLNAIAQVQQANGTLGLPISGELPTADRAGRYQTFTGGSVFWSPATAAHAVRNAIRDYWARSGWERGWLGFPSSEETAVPGGVVWYQDFVGGRVFWSASTGGHAVPTSGVRAVESAGGVAVVGPPTTEQLPTASGAATYQQFSAGSVFSSPATGSHAVTGPVLQLWSGLRWERGPLGLPTGDLVRSADGRYSSQAFEHGSVYSAPDTGAHEVLNAIQQAYAARGGPASALGLPITGEVPSGTGWRTTFQHGSISWSAAGGAVVQMRG